MKKAILVPDSFKGTMSSTKICSVMKEKIKEFYPFCEVVSVPVADGGEGSVDCFLEALGGEKIFATVKGPYFENMEGFYGILPDKKTAVIEMAACAGLPLVEDRKNPELTTTYGVGQLMLDAAKRGCDKIIVGLGGSCTNDAGCGAASACGIEFYNKNGDKFIPVGKNLSEIDRISTENYSRLLDNVKIITMCDIDNPTYGVSGAAYIFAPQKGADENAVKRLDEGLRHTCEIIKRDIGVSVDSLPGGGAAGGFGAGMSAFFGSVIQMGIETVLDTVGFDKLISDADIVFTGEGRLDSQSLRGKVVIGVSSRAKNKNVPVIAVVGDAEYNIDSVYAAGVTAVFPTNRKAEPFSVARLRAEENLSLTFDNIMRTLVLGGF